MIYQRLGRRPHGFGELERAMPRVTAKELREQLRQMQADHLVMVGPVFTSLWQWGISHLARRGAARATLVRSPMQVSV